jgi:hypothetical protein
MTDYKNENLIFSVLLTLLFATTCSLSYAQSRKEVENAIRSNAVWAPISRDAKEKIHYIDTISLKTTGDEISVWIAEGNADALYRLDLNCNQRTFMISSWTRYIVDPFNESKFNQSSVMKIPANSVAEIVANKLCGTFIPQLAVISKYLFSTKDGNYSALM